VSCFPRLLPFRSVSFRDADLQVLSVTLSV